MKEYRFGVYIYEKIEEPENDECNHVNDKNDINSPENTVMEIHTQKQ